MMVFRKNIQPLLVTVVFAVVSQLLFNHAAFAEKYALLVGVSDYISPKITDLQGPQNDVRVLADILQRNLGFSASNITSLVNSQATKNAILNQIDRLCETTVPGDFIFIYFSGHGTSSLDKKWKWNMSPYTGALLAADYKISANHDKNMQRLLIGTRDLRKRFKKLEQGKSVVVVIDACFSGNTVRGVEMGGIPPQVFRMVDFDLIAGDLESKRYRSADCSDAVYPYQNIIYFSASSKNERARDITAREIKRGRFSTIDNLPHGAFTDYFLRGLVGKADSNYDNYISANELYQFVRNRVAEKYGHTPQLLQPQNNSGNEVIFSLKKRTAPGAGNPSSSPDKDFAIRAEKLSYELIRKLSALPKVNLVEKNAEIIIAPHNNGYEIYQKNGSIICQVDSEEELFKRIKRFQDIRKFAGLDWMPKKYNLFLRALTDKGVLPEGETFGIRLGAEKSSHILLLNVNTKGMVDIIYPINTHEFHATDGFVAQEFCEVTGPDYGTEYMIAIAFSSPPPFYNTLLQKIEKQNGKAFSPDAPIIREIHKAITGPHFAAATVLQLKTASKEDLL